MLYVFHNTLVHTLKHMGTQKQIYGTLTVDTLTHRRMNYKLVNM